MSQHAETETVTLREAITWALAEEMERDEGVVIWGEDVGEAGHVSNLTEGLYEEFGPERVRDAPLAENGFVGAGVGAAATGLRPVVDTMYADFFGVACEQMFNQMTKIHYMFGGQLDVPLVVRASEGAGLNAAAQHSKTPHTILAHMTGSKVVTPGTPAAAKGLMKAAIRADDPVFYFENKRTYTTEGEVPTDEEFVLPLGEASVERGGEDVTVVATQAFVNESLAVAEALAGDVSVEVIDLRSLYPLDHGTIADSVRKTGRLVVADESPLSYGTHAEIVTRMSETAFYTMDAPPQRVGWPDTPVPFAPSLENEVMPGREELRRAIERLA